MANTSKPFRREPPPKIIDLFGTILFYGMLTPARWIIEKFGKMQNFLTWFGKRSLKFMGGGKAFGNYSPTENDVFIAVGFKSGTNWTMQIAHQIAQCGEGVYDHIHDVVPWPEMRLPGFAIPLENESIQKQSPTGLRVIKTHLAADAIPINDKARYISVIRDPKDVFVSSYFFVRDIALGPLMPSPNDWFEAFLTPNFPLGGWAHHTQSFWALRNRPNVLVLSFKEMKHNLEGTVKKIAEFMGVALSEEQFSRVVEQSSFAHMKSIDAKFYPGKMFPGGSDHGNMMRKGKQGDSGEMLSWMQQKRIDEHFQAELKQMGSDFPYNRFCDLA